MINGKIVQALPCPAEGTINGGQEQYVIADRSHAGYQLVDWMVEQNITVMIALKSLATHMRSYDKWVYQGRGLIDCFVNELNHFHRHFSRFDKLTSPYLSFLQFVGNLVWLRDDVNTN